MSERLVPVAIDTYERRFGLTFHLRRADAPVERPQRRCICGAPIVSYNRKATRCSACTETTVNKARERFEE